MKRKPADFSFSRAVREWCFVQLPLLDVARFRKEAKSRGLSDLGLFDRDAWETLDREELLAPVAYARHGMWQHDMVGCLADGDLAVREEVGYRPWAQLCEEAEAIGQDAAPQVLYHHWQLFWLAELQDCLTPAVAWSQLGEGLDDFFAAGQRSALYRTRSRSPSCGRQRSDGEEQSSCWSGCRTSSIRASEAGRDGPAGPAG